MVDRDLLFLDSMVANFITSKPLCCFVQNIHFNYFVIDIEIHLEENQLIVYSCYFSL